MLKNGQVLVPCLPVPVCVLLVAWQQDRKISDQMIPLKGKGWCSKPSLQLINLFFTGQGRCDPGKRNKFKEVSLMQSQGADLRGQMGK